MTCSHHNQPHYAHGLCKSCYCQLPQQKTVKKKYMEKYRKRHPEKFLHFYNPKAWESKSHLARRFRRVQNVYGTKPEEYIAIYEKQDKKCAMCLKPFPLLKLQTDHDHQKPQKHIRGLLCRPCNVFLGYVEKRPLISVQAQFYLASAENIVH